ncbi:MAG: type II CAAX prenyl endopeptidase Rce1 family protein [Novosphingobium sp.]
MQRWQVLTMGGLLGVASLWLVPFEILVPEINFTTNVRLVLLIQPAILTLVAVLMGQYLASRVGLGAPLIDAALTQGSVTAALRHILPFAIFAGLVSALILIAHATYVVPEIARSSALGAKLSTFEMPLLPKLFYGGITEELLTRWGLMSLFAWLGWLLSGRPERPRNRIFWFAIVGSALVFALGHLPLLLVISPDPQPWLVEAVLLGNTIPGILFGWLFWKKGIEAAMLAHMLTHLVSTFLT